MFRWPVSRWSHAGISFATALATAATVFVHINNSHAALYAAEYPHDGQVGLGAFMDALEAAAWTFILVFLITFVAQLIFTAGEDSRP
jgi:hypothetical protein